LKELDLAWNNMSTSLHLFVSLRSVESLDVSMNALGSRDEALEQFSSALRFNDTLLHLNITKCRLTEQHARLLVRSEGGWVGGEGGREGGREREFEEGSEMRGVEKTRQRERKGMSVEGCSS
jgi:hypothetical protein